MGAFSAKDSVVVCLDRIGIEVDDGSALAGLHRRADPEKWGVLSVEELGHLNASCVGSNPFTKPGRGKR